MTTPWTSVISCKLPVPTLFRCATLAPPSFTSHSTTSRLPPVQAHCRAVEPCGRGKEERSAADRRCILSTFYGRYTLVLWKKGEKRNQEQFMFVRMLPEVPGHPMIFPLGLERSLLPRW